jgi:hypothetical protein
MRSLCVLLLSLAALTAQAAETPDTVQALRAELERMKAEQAAREAEMRKLEDRLTALEAAAGPAPAGAPAPASPPAQPVVAKSAEPPSPLTVSGDLRLRYENNVGDEDARDWSRGTLRARLGARYVINDWVTIGGRFATGDPDDPNSVDVTLSNFADDLEFSLDQAYAELKLGGSMVWGGKFATPFVRTGLVWDGDVNPQGVGATYAIPVGGAKLKATGLYFLVDNSVAGSDSSMWGGQLGVELPLGENFQFELAGAMYDYTLASLAGADIGDFRTNLIGPDGRYLSDYDLADAIAVLSFDGWERWPLKLTGEYVKNRGAAVDGDTGYNVELSAGRLDAPGDWKIDYGYSVAEVDAVLAAFSHDDTTIATNYRQHSLVVNYALTKRVLLDATWYHYRPYDPTYALINDPDDWLDRIRLHFQVKF